MNDKLDDLIKEHNGKRSVTWIAAQAGSSTTTVRRRAAALGLSIIVPQYAARDKEEYHVRPPTNERARFATMVNDLMDELGLRSQNTAICAAVERAHGETEG